MRKIYLIHLKEQDISGVRRKGEVRTVVEGRQNPFATSDLVRAIEKGVTDLDTSADYILPVGSSLVNFLSGLVLGLKRPRSLKLMIHDAKSGEYKEVVLNMNLEVRDGR